MHTCGVEEAVDVRTFWQRPVPPGEVGVGDVGVDDADDAVEPLVIFRPNSNWLIEASTEAPTSGEERLMRSSSAEQDKDYDDVAPPVTPSNDHWGLSYPEDSQACGDPQRRSCVIRPPTAFGDPPTPKQLDVSRSSNSLVGQTAGVAAATAKSPPVATPPRQGGAPHASVSSRGAARISGKGVSSSATVRATSAGAQSGRRATPLGSRGRRAATPTMGHGRATAVTGPSVASVPANRSGTSEQQRKIVSRSRLEPSRGSQGSGALGSATNSAAGQPLARGLGGTRRAGSTSPQRSIRLDGHVDSGSLAGASSSGCSAEEAASSAIGSAALSANASMGSSAVQVSVCRSKRLEAENRQLKSRCTTMEAKMAEAEKKHEEQRAEMEQRQRYLEQRLEQVFAGGLLANSGVDRGLPVKQPRHPGTEASGSPETLRRRIPSQNHRTRSPALPASPPITRGDDPGCSSVSRRRNPMLHEPNATDWVGAVTRIIDPNAIAQLPLQLPFDAARSTASGPVPRTLDTGSKDWDVPELPIDEPPQVLGPNSAPPVVQVLTMASAPQAVQVHNGLETTSIGPGRVMRAPSSPSRVGVAGSAPSMEFTTSSGCGSVEVRTARAPPNSPGRTVMPCPGYAAGPVGADSMTMSNFGGAPGRAIRAVGSSNAPGVAVAGHMSPLTSNRGILMSPKSSPRGDTRSGAGMVAGLPAAQAIAAAVSRTATPHAVMGTQPHQSHCTAQRFVSAQGMPLAQQHTPMQMLNVIKQPASFV